MRILKLLLIFPILIGCSSENENTNENVSKYTGNYQIISYKSDIEVDLNDDNIASSELIKEIDYYFIEGFPDFEIRPNADTQNEAKLVSLFLPKTNITFQDPGKPQGKVMFSRYGFTSTFNFKNNNFILNDDQYLESDYIDNVHSNRKTIIDSEINIIDETHLKMKLSKEYYDFKTKKWSLLNILIILKKID
ncbi:hypothetical protein ACEN2I_11145 [Flavobacterium sp. W22_SRS_FK3]|uniref:hypothetical protein n=1 Tax=Flavobacterium sp. W22_SRS_FK3 TaxID=3240275 RepID=UPI003F934A6B